MNKATLSHTAAEIDTAITMLHNKLLPTGTLPAQVILSGNCNPVTPKVTLSWAYQDSNATGIMIRRKKDRMPKGVSDGEFVCEFRDTSITYFEDEDFDSTVGTIDNPATYYYRAFPFNKDSQMQTQYQASIELGAKEVKVYYMPNGSVLGDIPAETLLRMDLIFSRWGKNEKTVEDLEWTIRHIDSNSRLAYLVAKNAYSATTWMYDANEPTNPVTTRRTQGNSRWAVSNIRQFHNSTGNANEWWTAQSDYDAQPSTYNAYPAFLHFFTPGERALIVPRKHTLYIPSDDGGGTESVTDTVWCCTTKDLGLENDSLEGNVVGDTVVPFSFDGFTNNADRAFAYNYWTPTIYWHNSAYQLWGVSAAGALSNNSYNYGASSTHNYAPRAGLILPLSALLQWDETEQKYRVIVAE